VAQERRTQRSKRDAKRASAPPPAAAAPPPPPSPPVENDINTIIYVITLLIIIYGRSLLIFGTSADGVLHHGLHESWRRRKLPTRVHAAG
jgi:hypothetical protein